MHTPLMSPGRCTRQLAVPSDCVRLSLRTERFLLTMPARWSAKVDQPVTGLAVAAELPWVWIPHTISPAGGDYVVRPGLGDARQVLLTG
jgi:hypothetical protein